MRQESVGAKHRRDTQIYLSAKPISKFGATRGNRTPKGCPTASLVLRVYQFRHGRICET